MKQNVLETPLVSIIITTYKRPELLSRAINSVLKQTYHNIEIIVVDDNDPDTDYRQETIKVMSAYESYNNIYYLQQPKNMKQPAALNRGISVSKGEFIGFLDDDDEFLPMKIEMQVELLLQNEELQTIGGVYCNNIKDIQGKQIYSNCKKNIDEGILLFKMLMGEIHLGSTVLLKKEVFKKVLFNENIKRHVDYEFYCRYFNNYTLLLVEKPLIKIYIDGARNNPKSTDYLNIKEDLFKSVDSYLRILPKKEYNQIYTHNYLDVALSFFANKQFQQGWIILKKAVSYGAINKRDFVLLLKVLVRNGILK